MKEHGAAGVGNSVYKDNSNLTTNHEEDISKLPDK